MKIVCNKVREGRKSRATAAVSTREISKVAQLVDEAAGGNFEAFGQLYGIYLDRIYRYAFHQVKDRMTAEDITEEVFVKAWKAINSCKGKEQTFSSWLYRIAHNQVIDNFRSRQKHLSIESIELEPVAEASDPKLKAEAKLERQELLEVIACLPQNQLLSDLHHI